MKFPEPPADMYRVYCQGCGRFLGYEGISDGVAVFYCNKCKTFSTVWSDFKEVRKKPDVKDVIAFLDALMIFRKGLTR